MLKNRNSSNRLSLKDQSEAAIKLSGYQRELREAVQRKVDLEIKERKLSVSAIAQNMGLAWGQLTSFLKREHAVSSPRAVSAMTKYVQRPDLNRAMLEMIEKLGSFDSKIGLTIHVPEVIQLAFDLHEAYASDGKGMTQREFATAFQPHADIVQGVLMWNQTEAARLTDVTVVVQLLQVLLADDFAEQIQKGKQQARAELRPQAQELSEICARLRTRYVSLDELAADLKIGITTLHNARAGSVSSKTMEGMLQAARELERKHTPTSKRAALSPPSEPKQFPAHEPTPSSVPVPSTQQVLTQGTFRLIPWKPDEEELLAAVRIIKLARAYIDAFSQIKDDEIRARSRVRLGPEVQELFMSIRLYGKANPMSFTAVVDAERQTLKDLELEQTQVATVTGRSARRTR